ncbi:hypothetical protein DWV00_23050 [Trinickia dinghuensis]|uniref:Uncharacterized protein n=1 Tax=Trinickia dinghuensis TaxID=2291023 RepID=A0A3D8JTQ2_9BURK|nr:hypothetical protein DWV00_23050 [Trinickia dinghuensis]
MFSCCAYESNVDTTTDGNPTTNAGIRTRRRAGSSKAYASGWTDFAENDFALAPGKIARYNRVSGIPAVRFR